MSKGWISLHRQFSDHWLWEEKRVFSKAEAWLDILMAVNHSEQKVVIKNIVYLVKRGDSIMSLDSWAKRWKWNKSKVRRFLIVLQSDSMIVTKNETQTTRLTVCNYDSYQSINTKNETQTKRKRNADETQTTPNNNDNNENNEKYINLDDDKKNIFNSWLDYRVSIRKPIINIKTVEALLNKFTKYDIDKIEYTVNASIENSYQGLFWDNYNSKKSNKDEKQQALKRLEETIRNGAAGHTALIHEIGDCNG